MNTILITAQILDSSANIVQAGTLVEISLALDIMNRLSLSDAKYSIRLIAYQNGQFLSPAASTAAITAWRAANPST